MLKEFQDPFLKAFVEGKYIFLWGRTSIKFIIMLLKLSKLVSLLEQIFSNNKWIIIFMQLLSSTCNRKWVNELFTHEWHNDFVILFSQSNQILSSSQYLLPATQHVRMMSLALNAQLMLIHRWHHTSYLRMTLLSWTQILQECGAETCQLVESSYTNVRPIAHMEQEIVKRLLFMCMVSDCALSFILNFN